MNRRKFLSSAVALAVAPALPAVAVAPSIAAPVVPAGLPLLLAHDHCARLFVHCQGEISLEFVNGKFSGTISIVDKGGK